MEIFKICPRIGNTQRTASMIFRKRNLKKVNQMNLDHQKQPIYSILEKVKRIESSYKIFTPMNH